jgi:hypothetical protein
VQDGLYLAGGQFIIEPHVMLAVGLCESDLEHDIYDHRAPSDTAQFGSPENVDDND